MSFLGTTNTDFLKLPKIQDELKSSLIDYSVTDFYSIRNRLAKYIRATYPNDFTNFNESDLGIMFLELVAYMGAVLSHKADMLANESFIRTVKTRSNLAKLLELIGVKMKGPTSSAGSAKVTFDTTATGTYSIKSENRIITVNSPLDTKPVTYTLYNSVGGVIKTIEDNGADIISFTKGSGTYLYNNLVLVEGALVVESGIFESTDVSKRIVLSRSPIIDGSVGVYINDGAGTATGTYRQIDKMFFASGSSDKAFSLETDDQYRGVIQLGDNIFGISPSKSATFKVFYRIGGGPRGNQDKEAINTKIKLTKDSVEVEATLENSTNITGGTVAESMVHAKEFAALEFRRQNRVVTLGDYISFVNSMKTTVGAIGRATAVTRKAFSSSNVIDVYVLEKANDHQLQRASTSLKNEILTALEEVKMLTDHVVICDGLIRTLDINITVKIDKENAQIKESIKLAVANKIMSYFNVDRFNYGQKFSVDDLSRFIFQTKGVRYATIDNIPRDIPVDFNEIIQLNNFTINMVEV